MKYFNPYFIPQTKANFKCITGQNKKSKTLMLLEADQDFLGRTPKKHYS